MQERWYQREAIQSIFDYFDSGNTGNPVIAMPTASGKTHVISGFIKRVMQQWPSQRFIVGTHVKELIHQNASKFAASWPYAPYGIHSEGLKSRDYMQPIIFGGIQSMVKNVDLFGHRDLMIIDECHLVSPKEGTNYQIFINGLKARNPRLKVIGLSATIWRQGNGLITENIPGRIFTDVCYNLTTMENFARLIAEGFLCPLVTKNTVTKIDVSNVGIGANGDYNSVQLEKAADKVTYAALQEAIYYGQNRYSWLAFSSGVEHAEKIGAMLTHMGVSNVVVHSKLKDAKERDRRIEMHKRGEVRCMVGNNIFTTGYDHPPLDLIIDLQPTMSVAKHVQKYGRAMRISPQTYKQNGLILDFAGNTVRCGPINDPYIPRRKGGGTGDAPVKICEHCNSYNHAAARFCESCGEPFTFQVKIVDEATTAPVMVSDLPIVETYPVDRVFYYPHVSKKTGIKSLVCSYWSGLSKYDEWVNFEHPKARHFANEWWRQRSPDEPPMTVDDALTMTAGLRIPKAIRVWVNTPNPKILGVEW